MSDQTIQPSRLKSALTLVMIIFLASCSQGIRIKNWVNYPVEIYSMEALDTLKISPEIVKFVGPMVKRSQQFQDDIRIQGRHDTRPLWVGAGNGCFTLDNEAEIYISDFNFQGTPGSTSLIRVQSGRLILENCSFRSAESWAIEVGPQGSLELLNVDFGAGGEGAILVNGGIVRIYDSRFIQAGKTAILVNQAKLFEIHSSILTHNMGTALDINGTDEVWLDSIRVQDSFQDGISITDCDYVLIDQVESRENGRSGLTVRDAKICGILNFFSLGNLVNGLEIHSVDTLRMINSELVSNGQLGGFVENSLRSRISGIRVGHNGGDGLTIRLAEELWVDRSSFQANPEIGLTLDSLGSLRLDQISLVSNGLGLQAGHFDSLEVTSSLFSSNQRKGLAVSHGLHMAASKNLIKNNSSGLNIKDVLYVKLDSNHVEANELGNDIKAISNLVSRANVWDSNASAAYFSEIGSMSSTGDTWRSNLDTGLEILDAEELILREARFHNNRNGALFNEVSLRISSSRIDSSRDVGIKLMNGSLVMEDSKIENNGVGLEIAQGSQARITQSQFNQNDQHLNAEPSVSLTFTFSTVRSGRRGINLGNYVEASILSSNFDKLKGSAIVLSGPHTQSVKVRQSVVANSGRVLKSNARSGDISLQSNTFANNTKGLEAIQGSLAGLDHNIFYKTPHIELQMMKHEQAYKWNCLFPAPPKGIQDVSPNIYVDPVFGTNFYLRPNSPCLHGGENGLLIGALGAEPVVRPNLQP